MASNSAARASSRAPPVGDCAHPAFNSHVSPYLMTETESNPDSPKAAVPGCSLGRHRPQGLASNEASSRTPPDSLMFFTRLMQ